jgi:monoamine oxidase
MHGGRKSPLLRAIKEHAQARYVREDPDATFEDAVATVERGAISRRDVLRYGGLVGAGLAMAACTPSAKGAAGSRTTPHDARVAVIGAGLAGVTAAYRLSQAGVRVQLYEARERIGGRCWTATGFAQGQTAEHGGEFIDTRHVHLRQLAHELGLPLDDLWEGWRTGSKWPNFVDGEILDSSVVNEQSDRIAKAAVAEAKRIGVFDGGKPSTAAISYGTATPGAVALDRLTMDEWLDANVPGVLDSAVGRWFDEAMAAWYGLNMEDLSAVNWIDYFVIPVKGADERWRVRGGNDQVPNLAAERLPADSVHPQTPLESLRVRGDGVYELRFTGSSTPAVADVVILALPFSTLRQVDLAGAGLSAARLQAISDLTMGYDVKLLLQYDRRPTTFDITGGGVWSGGMEHTDPDFETWESSTDERGSAGLITVYAGGRTGASWTADRPHGPAPAALTKEIVGHIDDVVPGTAASFNGTAWVDLWTRDPWTQGAYAAFGPQQYTKLWGYTARAESNIHFAGEHTSTYSQGYLNGGVESGDRAAVEVMRTLGVTVPPALADLPYSPA